MQAKPLYYAHKVLFKNIFAGTRFGLGSEEAHGPAGNNPESVPFSFSHLADSLDPHVSTDTFFLPQSPPPFSLAGNAGDYSQ
jgi:hypothetical protein